MQNILVNLKLSFGLSHQWGRMWEMAIGAQVRFRLRPKGWWVGGGG